MNLVYYSMRRQLVKEFNFAPSSYSKKYVLERNDSVVRLDYANEMMIPWIKLMADAKIKFILDWDDKAVLFQTTEDASRALPLFYDALLGAYIESIEKERDGKRNDT